MTDNEQREKWHADETRWKWAFGLMLTVMLATVAHLATGFYWAGGISERVLVVERDHRRLSDRTQEQITRQETNLRLLQSEIQSDRIASARQEEKLETVIELLERMRLDFRKVIQRSE